MVQLVGEAADGCQKSWPPRNPVRNTVNIMYSLTTARFSNVKTTQIWDLGLNLKTPIYGAITWLTRGITGRKTGSCGILIGPAADTEQHCRADTLESITRRCQVAVQDLGKLDIGRK